MQHATCNMQHATCNMQLHPVTVTATVTVTVTVTCCHPASCKLQAARYRSVSEWAMKAIKQ